MTTETELVELRAEVERLTSEREILALERRVSDDEMVSLLKRANKGFCDARDNAHDALRELASYVGSGGYNAESVDATTFVSKIRDGIDSNIACWQRRAETAERERDAWKGQHDAVLSQARKDNLRAEDADRYEQWLLDIGKLSGCGHVDDNLTRCIEQYVHGLERERDALREVLQTAPVGRLYASVHMFEYDKPTDEQQRTINWLAARSAALATQGAANAD